MVRALNFYRMSVALYAIFSVCYLFIPVEKLDSILLFGEIDEHNPPVDL